MAIDEHNLDRRDASEEDIHWDQDLDANDPLADFRERFLIPDGIIYMNGNSLGPLTCDARDRIKKTVNDEWGEELIRGWNSAGWYELPWRAIFQRTCMSWMGCVGLLVKIASWISALAATSQARSMQTRPLSLLRTYIM